MKLTRWMMVIFAGALTMGVLPSAAVPQVPFEQLPKVFDASMSRDEQISIALSAGPDLTGDFCTR